MDPKVREARHQLSERYISFLHQDERISADEFARASQTCPPTEPVSCEVALEALKGLEHRDDVLRHPGLTDPPANPVPQTGSPVIDSHREKTK